MSDLWRRADGQQVRIQNMSIGYLENVVALLETRHARLLERIEFPEGYFSSEHEWEREVAKFFMAQSSGPELFFGVYPTMVRVLKSKINAKVYG